MFTDDSFQNKTTPGVPDVFDNPHSWNTVANMLFLETPPSVRPSSPHPGLAFLPRRPDASRRALI